MRSGMVVPIAEFQQLLLQVRSIQQVDLLEGLLEAAKEPFGAVVLPRTVQLDGWEPDAQ